jgi:hypothetical protein
MFGSVALCNSVDQWATQMGTFLIESIRAYTAVDDDPAKYQRLTVEDVYRSTEVRPIPHGGKLYVPRRKATMPAPKGRPAPAV